MCHIRPHKKLCVSVYQDDTSGDYKEVLLALTGDRPAPEVSAEEQAEAEEEQEIEQVEEEQIVVRIPFPIKFRNDMYFVLASTCFQ